MPKVEALYRYIRAQRVKAEMRVLSHMKHVKRDRTVKAKVTAILEAKMLGIHVYCDTSTPHKLERYFSRLGLLPGSFYQRRRIPKQQE